MEIEIEIIKKQNLQSLVLCFIENDDDEENFNNLATFIQDSNISKNKLDLLDLFHLILHIASNHHRESNFFDKIIKIFLYLNFEIKNFFTDQDIYNIFITNKMMILFLIQNKIIIPSEKLINLIISNDHCNNDKLPYRYFLYPVIKEYINESQQKNIEKEISQIFEMDINLF